LGVFPSFPAGVGGGGRAEGVFPLLFFFGLWGAGGGGGWLWGGGEGRAAVGDHRRIADTTCAFSKAPSGCLGRVGRTDASVRGRDDPPLRLRPDGHRSGHASSERRRLLAASLQLDKRLTRDYVTTRKCIKPPGRGRCRRGLHAAGSRRMSCGISSRASDG